MSELRQLKFDLDDQTQATVSARAEIEGLAYELLEARAQNNAEGGVGAPTMSVAN